MQMNEQMLRIAQRSEQEIFPGVKISRFLYVRQDGSQFAACAVTAQASAARLVTGTAGGGYARMDSVDDVPSQMRTAMDEGLAVIAGINAGYFRRKWHFAPYGLSVRKGVEIAPPHSEPRVAISGGIELGVFWLGVTKSGELVFGSEEDYPRYRGKLDYATSFPHYLICRGASAVDCGHGEGKREPRSAFGVGADGSFVLLAIDGRQPEYSTGASNWETAQVLLALGVTTGVNLDGGGSTHLAVCGPDGRITTVNRPCEERKVFDTLLLVRHRL